MTYLKNKKLERQSFCFVKFDLVATDKKAEYKSNVESLGMMIYNNGLVSTLGHLKHKKSPIYEHIAEWIVQHKVIDFTLATNADILTEVLKINDSMVLNALTIEILLLSDTLKEIVKAES